MNPVGILFDSNAHLIVPAFCTTTTATGIGSGTDRWCNAIAENDYPN
jgi:hypothetical protein